MSKLLKIPSCMVTFQRCRHKLRYNWVDEGIQYPGFKYYPREPDFKDPPYTPSKLFKVRRVKPLKHLNPYEKQFLKEFGLDHKKGDPIVIIKNIPENNSRLWKIKHLIEIKPITFPDGFPQDTTGTYLNENGQLRVSQSVSEERLKLGEEFRTKTQRLDGDTLRRESRQRWLSVLQFYKEHVSALNLGEIFGGATRDAAEIVKKMDVNKARDQHPGHLLQ